MRHLDELITEICLYFNSLEKFTVFIRQAASSHLYASESAKKNPLRKPSFLLARMRKLSIVPAFSSCSHWWKIATSLLFFNKLL